MIADHKLVVAKPKALPKGSTIALFSPASPGEKIKLQSGIAELQRLGFNVSPPVQRPPIGYFSGTHEARMLEFVNALENKAVDGLIASRGGYGSSHLFDGKFNSRLAQEKSVIGFSDVNALQIYIWQARHWVTFYGPMVGAGFAAGAGNANGYDENSFLQAIQSTASGWNLPLSGETLFPGEARGRLLGGCLTLLLTTIGTGWELDTSDAILVLEDRGMKPYQVDRALLHLLQAGKFRDVRGIILGDFPECDAPNEGGPSVRDVCRDILGPLKVPIIYGAPVGHTNRPMLTLPLGVKSKLDASGQGTLEILEAAVHA
jgi:muramoyltetrapeptide carboxypeptidase